MKIVIVETRVDHYETLGYFFYLKQRNPNMDMIIYAQDPDNMWLKFFNNKISYIKIRSLKELRYPGISPINGYLVFINSIDIYYTGKGREEIDYHVKKFTTYHKFNRICLQLHMGENVMANQYKDLDVEFVSPFPNPGCKHMIMPYSFQINNSNSLLQKTLRFSVVGGFNKINLNTLKVLSSKVNITHYCRGISNRDRVKGIKYICNLSTDKLINNLELYSDYILIDYPFRDRMSGIVTHAIALEIPLIINKEYADLLNLPDDIYIAYDDPQEIINNADLYDQDYHTQIKGRIREYKNSLISEADNYFLYANMFKIKMVIFDFDGVFTDCRFYFSNSNTLLKSYNGKDSYALKILRQNGILTGVITNDKYVSIQNAPHIFDRLDRYSIGADRPKEDILNEWLEELNIKHSEVAYIGDDLPDIGIMNIVGFSGCPSDAVDLVKRNAKYICEHKGGDGAVREFVDHIITKIK